MGSLSVGIGWRTGPYTNTGVVDPTSGLPVDGRVLALNALTTVGNVNTGAIEEVAPGTWKITSKVAMPAGVGLECSTTSTTALCPGVTVTVYGRAVKPNTTPAQRIPLNAAVRYASSNRRGSLSTCPTATGPRRSSAWRSATPATRTSACTAGRRQGSVEMCATCHNTEATYARWYRPDPVTGVPAAQVEGTVDFKVMVHEIHNGKLWLNNIEGATYPAPGAYCQACHVSGNNAYFTPIAGSNGTTTKIDPANAANNLRTTTWFAPAAPATRRVRRSPTCAASAAARA